MSRPILVTESFNVPAERLFAALDDNETMGRWMGVPVTVVQTVADKGVGTVRRLKIGLKSIDEEIVEREPPRRIAYKIVRGLAPLSHHFGEILVTSRGPSASQVEWRIELESNVPLLGAVVRAGLGRGIARALRKLRRQLSN
ncbi:MAG TPA: SRPBCC family protein [Polyangiaceae bacterium]|jgi:uncharacterized protein YndB with AHSA1/START domain|nr:SRPBCC family protein [Polyangiaceae bacterium]